MEILSLTTTVASREDAERLARALLDRRLAACVQVDDGVQSHYRWKGESCVDTEVRLTIKSLPERLAALQDFMAEQHPYEVPQLLWQAMAASPAYAEWVRREVEG
jgi:periplasmic divalent cation tolerance protein